MPSRLALNNTFVKTNQGALLRLPTYGDATNSATWSINVSLSYVASRQYYTFPGGSTYVSVSSPQYIAYNDDNIFTIIKNGVFVGPYTAIPGMSLGEERLIATFANGNYIKVRKQSATISYLRFYLANNTLVLEYGFPANPTTNPSDSDYYYYAGISVLQDVSLSNDIYDIVTVLCRPQYFNIIEVSALNNSYYKYLGSFFGDGYQIINDPYGTVPQEQRPGGFGPGDYNSDDIDFPNLPAVSAASCGFVGLYNPTLTELQNLASYMWTGVFDLNTYKKIFGDPMDCILSVGIVPVELPRSTNKESLKFANVDSGVDAYKITSQFVSLDCGSVTLKGETGSAMDYSPYTKLSIFLPYCGTHDLSVDDCQDATISVKYNIDLYTGVCVALVKVEKTNSDESELSSVLYQFTGNVLCTIPITGADHSQFIQSALFAAAATAATIASSGGAAAAGAGELGGAAATGDVAAGITAGGAARMSAAAINSVMSLKPDITRSGNLSSNAGFLGEQKPYLILTWPNLCRPTEEYKLSGMPLQQSGVLGDFEGFTIINACHFDGLLCTQAELRMIEQALYTGVII